MTCLSPLASFGDSGQAVTGAAIFAQADAGRPQYLVVPNPPARRDDDAVARPGDVGELSDGISEPLAIVFMPRALITG